MEKGMSYETKYIISSLPEDILSEIDELVLECHNCSTEVPTFEEELNDYYDRVTLKDASILCRYTGYEFRNINAILRNNWTYEENGKYTEEKGRSLIEYSSMFSRLIDDFPVNKKTFITYRGTTIDEFKKYDISSLEELSSLKGKFLYEKGFTSTSLSEEKSYFKKDINGSVKNIEIKYIVPENSQDGIPLTREELSFSKNQQEYVLNKNALSKVIDVKIEGDTAVLTVVLIPKRIWNRPIKVESNTIKKS